MAGLHLASASDITAEVIAIIDFLGTRAVTVGDDKSTVLQTTGDISSLLSSIDALRVRAHELLEAETISASKLRYKLNTLQQTFEVELAGAAKTAQAYIALQKRNKELCICEVNAAKAQAHKRQMELELENDDLTSRFISRERKYREQVHHVNEIMTNRSKVKICLNEVEEELRSILQKTKRCEQDKLQLEYMSKESLNEFVVDMEHLATSLEEVKTILACEYDKNKHLSKTCDQIEENVIRAKNKMEIAEKLLSDAVSRLESELNLRRKLEVSIVEARQQAEELAKKCVEIQQTSHSGRKNLHCKEEQLTEQHRMMMKAVEEIEVEVDAACAKQRKAQAALMKETKSKDKHQSSVSNIQKSLTSAKETLKYQSDQGAELQTQNRNLEFQLKECDDTFVIVQRQLQDQIAKLTDELKHKESFRTHLEKETEMLKQSIVSLENELKRITTQLKDVEERNCLLYSTSMEKLSTLKCESCRAEQHIQVLNQALSENTTQLQSFVTTVELQGQILQENIKTLEDNVSKKDLLIQALEPRCAGLEDEHARKRAAYDTEKESIISLRNHRSTLQNSAKRLRHELNDIISKKKQLRIEIIHQRTQTKDHFECQTLHSKRSETEVANTEQKLRAIVTENSRICEAIRDFKLECMWMTKHQTRPPKMDTVEVSRIREKLDTQWQSDQKMEQRHRMYCNIILSETALLSTQVEKRLKQLDHIYHTELSED